MNLTAQELSEVVACLRHTGSSSSNRENRRFNRLQVQNSFRISTLVDERLYTSYTVLIRDISFNGLGFVQTSPAQLGDHFVTHLPRSSNRFLFIISKVARCRILADRLFDIGAEFVRAPDENLLHQLLEANDRQLQQVRSSILH